MKGLFVIKLKGGLGNQLFQYAFSRRILNDYGFLNIHFDTSFYLSRSNDFPRDLVLERFIDFPRINMEITIYENRNIFSKLYIFYAKRRRNSKPTLSRILYWLYMRYGNYLKEDIGLGYAGQIFNNMRGKIANKEFIYFDGYWCDGRYFSSVMSQMRGIIKLGRPSKIFNDNLGILHEADVMIHVRRGDYLSIGTNKDGLFIGLDYYKRSIVYLIDSGVMTHESRLWVFSDDLDWCRQELPCIFPGQRFVWNSNTLSDEESFELMRYFSHKIIANSTYSLWAAYLTYKENGTIIIPKRWLESYEVNGILIQSYDYIKL